MVLAESLLIDLYQSAVHVCDLKNTRVTRAIFALFREKLPVHVVVDPVLGKVLRPHQRQVNTRYLYT